MHLFFGEQAFGALELLHGGGSLAAVRGLSVGSWRKDGERPITRPILGKTRDHTFPTHLHVRLHGQHLLNFRAEFRNLLIVNLRHGSFICLSNEEVDWPETEQTKPPDRNTSRSIILCWCLSATSCAAPSWLSLSSITSRACLTSSAVSLLRAPMSAAK